MIDQQTLIKSIGDQPMPPVEKWDPDYCGELDLLIKADGSWIYQATPLTRYKIKLLFSRVIKREGKNYFLVTPVEKLGIKVEWMPFVILDHQVINKNQKKIYCFKDGLENHIELTDLSQLKFSEYQGQQLPIIKIRRNLFASFSRQCYYRLIEEATLTCQQNKNVLQITSNGKQFSLGEFAQDD